MKLFAPYLLITLFSYQVSASCGLLMPPCSCGFRSDSYAYGLKKGLLGEGKMPAGLNDEVCFSYGVNDGKKASQSLDHFCKKEFKYSYAPGVSGKAHSSSLSACNHIGYAYGSAFLRVSARNSNINAIGKVCVDSYRRGQDEARSGAPYTIENNQFINACKLAGYYDEGEI